MENKKGRTKKGLGRGLEALIPNISLIGSDGSFEIDVKVPKQPKGAKSANVTGEIVRKIKLIDIEPNRDQPRRYFDEEKLQVLSESIKANGVLQPILVKPAGNGMYTIVSGERRWRASKLAGLKTIPCIVKEYSELEVMQIALIENLQREDLNPIEEAEGFKKLMTAFGLTQEEVSEKVGKSRSAVANSLRLNNLPSEIKELVIDEKLSQGHARTLLGIKDTDIQIEIAERIIKNGLSVRQTEAIVTSLSKTPRKKDKDKLSKIMSLYYSDVEKQLSDRFGTKVKIHPGKKKSKIEIEYYSKEDLERLLFEIQGT